jgi:hypothetical protein
MRSNHEEPLLDVETRTQAKRRLDVAESCDVSQIMAQRGRPLLAMED